MEVLASDETLPCAQHLDKINSQTTIKIEKEKPSWWTKKKIILLAIVSSIILAVLGVVLWYFLKDIDHVYYKGRINKYTTKSRNCVVQKSSEQDSYYEEVTCFNQTIISQLITLDVQENIVIQSLSINNITFLYDNGTELYFGGVTFNESIDDANQVVNLNDAEQLDEVPIFRTEVDPKTNTIIKVGVPKGLHHFVIQSALQQLMHSNTAIQDPDNLTSITGINYINGAQYKPRFEQNNSYLPKGVSVLKNLTKDDIINKTDGVENELDALINFNNDGEVTSSQFRGVQNINQDPLSEQDDKKMTLYTNTTQQSELIGQQDLNQIVDIVKKIQERQDLIIYDQSNITIAYMTKEQKAIYEEINSENNTRLLQNLPQPPAESSCFTYINNKQIASSNILGQRVSININVFGYRQSDSYLFNTQLILLVNGNPKSILLTESRVVKDRTYSDSYQRTYNVKILQFIYVIVAIPLSVDINTNFGYGYKINVNIKLPIITSYVEINGSFGLSAKAAATVLLATVGVGVEGTMAQVNIPLTSSIDITKKTAYAKLSLILSTNFQVYAYVQYQKCETKMVRECINFFFFKICSNVPKISCNLSDPNYLVQQKQIQGQSTTSLYEKTVKW
ncbi:hypothetical protein pb186bvf_010975 [Paramecium bursaria]